MAKYPGAAITARVTGLALRWRMRPSVLWRQVNRYPKDFQLLFGYMEWEYQETKKAMDKKPGEGEGPGMPRGSRQGR